MPAIWVIFIQSVIVAKVSLHWNLAGLRQGIYLARVLQLDDAALLWAKCRPPKCYLEILNRTSNSRAAQLVVTTVYGH